MFSSSRQNCFSNCILKHTSTHTNTHSDRMRPGNALCALKNRRVKIKASARRNVPDARCSYSYRLRCTRIFPILALSFCFATAPLFAGCLWTSGVRTKQEVISRTNGDASIAMDQGELQLQLHLNDKHLLARSCLVPVVYCIRMYGN